MPPRFRSPKATTVDVIGDPNSVTEFLHQLIRGRVHVERSGAMVDELDAEVEPALSHRGLHLSLGGLTKNRRRVSARRFGSLQEHAASDVHSG